MDANRKKIIIGTVIFVSLIAGVFLWKGKKPNQGKEASKTTEGAKAEETPEPTKEPEFKKSDFKIKILNGSGKAGLSTSLQKDLEAKDYKVANTGNADNFNYKKTVLQAKEKIPAKFIDELKDLLSNKYGSVETEKLEKDADTDVVIIIGGQQVEETAAPTKSAETTTAPTPTTSSPTLTPTPKLTP